MAQDQTLALDDLHRLRMWRTWLLILVVFGQGLQYTLYPQRPLANASYAALHAIGTRGWISIGVCMLVGAALMMSTSTRSYGYIFMAFLYLFLVIAILINGYWPGTTLLPVGLTMIEARMATRDWSFRWRRR